MQIFLCPNMILHTHNFPGKPVPIKCEVEEGVEGGEMKWKIGATYLDTPSSPVHDDYEDIISHELEFVPKKEVTHSVVKLSY